ncbi:uncharacterized protein SCHCODRAFT_02590072, partial [Schizophyllum commune H4-8]|uniref:uncharacterized protein n=1 Tax=Schizophyllum commune (strain H4-8 / FGSC 9210) TaxID=578458 RepID=UPI00215F79C0
MDFLLASAMQEKSAVSGLYTPLSPFPYLFFPYLFICYYVHPLCVKAAGSTYLLHYASCFVTP